MAENVSLAEGKVLKEILHDGTGELPKDTDEVQVHYTGTLEDGTEFDSSRTRGTPFKFRLGSGNVIKGWDVAVATMRIGERSMITIQSEYAYGAAGFSPKIPPDATLKFDIELISAAPQKKDAFAMTVEEKIERGNDLKESGNDAFRAGDLSAAADAYKEAIALFENCDDWADEFRATAQPVRLALHLNLANVCLKMSQWRESISNADLALKYQPGNVKALFRRGCARMEFELLEEAVADLTAAAKSDPGNREIRAVLAQAKSRLKAANLKDRALFSNMFNKVDFYSEKESVRLPRKLDDMPRVFMDVKIGENEAQRLTIALYEDTVPKTVKNFMALCDAKGDEPLKYLGSPFHRLIRGFMAQGGDFTKGDGTGGASIYGEKFEDENFVDKHERRGQLSMANSGPNTNGSQFFLTFGPQQHLDGKHVVFGEVVDGIEFLDTLESVETNDDKPKESITVVECGIV